MADDKNANLWIVLGIILVVIAVGWWMMSKNSTEDTDNSSTSNGEQVESTEDTGAGSVNATSPAATISYQNALVKYKDARLQLDTTCQGSPDRMVFKNGATLMVDNRAPVARTVKVGSTFSVKAWGFKLVKLSSATLPATWYVDCDKSQNVSTVLIQK